MKFNYNHKKIEIIYESEDTHLEKHFVHIGTSLLITILKMIKK